MKKHYFFDGRSLLLYCAILMMFSGASAQNIWVHQRNATTSWIKQVVPGEIVAFPTAANGPVSMSFFITNNSAASISITSIAISGADASKFSYDNPTTSMAPGGTAILSVGYNPTTSETASAQLQINCSSGPPFIFNLKGAAFDLYGPSSPPLGTVSTDFNGTIGRFGGRNSMITNVSLATKTATYWGPQISSTGDLMLKVSLNDPAYFNDENLTFAPAESNLSIGRAVWRGQTVIQNAMVGGIYPVYIRATLTTKNPNNTSMPMVDPLTLGLSPQIGGLIEFDALSDYLVANWYIEASSNGSSWMPYLDYYDSYPTPWGPLPGQGIGNAYSTVGTGFYWKNLAPRLTSNQIATLNEGSLTPIHPGLLNATDDEDMPANPSAIVFSFETSSEGPSPLAFETGVLKLGGTVLTKADTFTLADLQSGQLIFEHDGSDTVYDEFQFSFVDSKGKLGADGPNTIYSFKFNILPVNDAPVTTNIAIDGSYILPTTGMLTSTDSDSSTLLYSIFPGSVTGTITYFNPTTGEFTYTPTGNVGTDSFYFSVWDGMVSSNVSMVTLNLTNLPPTSSEQSFSTSEDTELSSNLTGSDPEGTPITYHVVSQGSLGSVAIQTNGTFTYTPNASAFGTDTFTFRVQDAQGAFSGDVSATVSITPRMDPGNVVIVDKTVLRMYDPATGHNGIISQDQGLTEAINATYRKNVGLFVFDKTNGLINVDPLTGVQSLVAAANQFSADGPIEAPGGMTIDNNGQLILAQAGGIVRVNPATGIVTPLFTGGLLTYPTGVVYHESGDLLVTDAGMMLGGSSRIIRITSTGVQSILSSGGNITLPLDLALLDQNTLVVSDAGSFAGGTDKLYKIDLSTGTQTLLANAGNLSIPSGIDAWNGVVYTVNKEGDRTVLAVDGTTGTQTIEPVSALINPWGLLVIPEDVAITGVTVTDEACINTLDGGFSIGFTGGVSPYSYTINGGSPAALASSPLVVSDLTGGSYLVSISDATGASAATTVEVATLIAAELATYYADTDSDGFGDLNAPMDACGQPAGYVTNSTDCDDTKASVNPSKTEVGYNLIDDDCDGLIDEGFAPIVSVVPASACGITLEKIDSYIYSTLVAGAQGYRWRVTNMSGTNNGLVQIIDTPLRSMKITQLPVYAFDTAYKIEVAVYYAGFLQPFTEMGCIVSTPATTTKIQTCGTTLTGMTNVIYANIVPFATGYKFKITDPINPNNTQEIIRPLREFRMNLVTDFEVLYGKAYIIQVAVRNTDGSFLPYGQACVLSSPPFPSTSIGIAQCDNGFGLPYAVPSMNTPIYANSYPGAIAYVFRLTGLGLPPNGIEIQKPLRVFSLNDFAGMGIVPGQSYNINVRLIFEVDAPIGSYGKTCTLTVPGSSRMMEIPFDALAYPNPFVDSFSIEIQSSAKDKAGVKVYDMTGRLLETRSYSPGDELNIGQGYPSGIYNVIVTQGESVKSLRVIKR